MKLNKSINNNLRFPSLWKTYSLLLLLIGISCQSFGQIHIGKNATFSIQEGTVVHISENSDDKLQTAKVYVGENAKFINFSTNSVAEIVYVKTEKPPQRSKEKILQNNSKKPLPPPMVKKDTKPESRKSVLSFVPKQTTPSALFYSGKTTKAALVENTSLRTKFFPQKNSQNNTIHSFLLNDDQQIKIASNEFLPLQTYLEEYITRPPPIQFS